MTHPPQSISAKIKNSLRLDRGFLLVWTASKIWTLLGVFATLCSGLIPLLSLYILKLIIDTIALGVQGIESSESFTRVIFLVGCATIAGVAQAGLNQLLKYIREVQGTKVTDYVSEIIHNKSIDLDLAYYENSEYHDTLHRAQQEGRFRPTKIVNGLTQVLQNGVSLAAMAGLLFSFHWSIGLLLFFSTVPGIFVQLTHARKRYAWQIKRTPEERRAGYIGSVLTVESFAKEIRLFNLGEYFINSFTSLRKLLRAEKLQLSKKQFIWEFFAQLFAALVLMGSLLFIAYRTISGHITVGDMVMYFQAFQRGVGYLKELLQNISSLYEDNLFIYYLFEFLDTQNVIKDPARPLKIPDVITKGIELKHVAFSYPDQNSSVLKDVSLSIGAGQVVALVGDNGAGKSTLVKLLCRLYDPEEGTIKLEGNRLDQYGIKELRKLFSIVFQDYQKYYLTVKENIQLGDIATEADNFRIEKAATKADADTFIKKLPEAYDTLLGRLFFKGQELSIGEWQKICLARAFLRESPFIILDEPTSSMDIHTEYHLYTKFKELIQGRSALIISHRFSTVRMADKIYVLNKGTIFESGSHEELLEKNGLYAEMYKKAQLKNSI